MLKLKYWCNSEDEKLEIYRILKENENTEKFEEKYNLNNVLEEKFDDKVEEVKKENVDLIIQKETKWYKKIVAFFKRIFSK